MVKNLESGEQQLIDWSKLSHTLTFN
jgi:hypothetical protein